MTTGRPPLFCVRVRAPSFRGILRKFAQKTAGDDFRVAFLHGRRQGDRQMSRSFHLFFIAADTYTSKSRTLTSHCIHVWVGDSNRTSIQDHDLCRAHKVVCKLLGMLEHVIFRIPALDNQDRSSTTIACPPNPGDSSLPTGLRREMRCHRRSRRRCRRDSLKVRRPSRRGNRRWGSTSVRVDVVSCIGVSGLRRELSFQLSVGRPIRRRALPEASMGSQQLRNTSATRCLCR
mmetsp:Transcript_82275/g.266354  ORF Transcript_82275/g.266354 Transcript_82275/m.266354 type:complete len:232 (+) Transcript_82275:910-1605(+)